MMERFAEGVIKHSKAIIVVWIIVLLASAPFACMALTSDDILTYSMQKSDDTESGKGLDILRENIGFDYDSLNSGSDFNSASYVVIIEYQTITQRNGVEAVADGLGQRLKAEYPDISMVILPIQGTEHKGYGFLVIDFSSVGGSPQHTKQIRNMIVDIRNTSGVEIGNTYVTGYYPITYDLSQSSMEDVKKIDPFAVLLVLVLIGLFFSSIVAAAVPPATIGVAFSLTLALIYLLAKVGLDVVYITPTVALVSMIGAGCDYCIFVVARYREERTSGKDKQDALIDSVRWAGESVLISGICVIICFGLISLSSYQLMSVLGIVLAFGIIVALFAAVTLIPAIINLVGDKIFYPSTIGNDGRIRSFFSKLGKDYFGHSARFSVKWAIPILIAAVVITVPLTSVAVNESTSFDLVKMMPDSESKDGVEILTDTTFADNKYGGIIMPVYIVMELKNPIASDGKVTGSSGKEYDSIVWSSDDDARNITYSTLYAMYSGVTMCKEKGLVGDIIKQRDLKKNIGIMIGAVSSEAFLDYAAELMNHYEYQKRTDWTKLSVETFIHDKAEHYIEEHPEFAENPIVKKLREVYSDLSNNDKGRYSVYDRMINSALGSFSMSKDGRQYVKSTIILKDQPMSDRSMETLHKIRDTCHNYENNQRTYEMPEIVVTYTTGLSALMMDAQQKTTDEFVKIDILAIALILLLLFFVMRSYLTPVRSVLTILMGVSWSLGLTILLFGHGQIFWVIPILVFLLCLGLGLDYDILLTTRIREYVGKGMDNDTAIAKALEHSGSIITICGIIMGGAFLSLMLSSTPLLQQLGFAIGFTVLVDALIIRTYIVPATMHLMGRWNWVGPKFLQGSK